LPKSRRVRDSIVASPHSWQIKLSKSLGTSLVSLEFRDIVA